MSDLFFNKIAAAGLAAALGFIAINKIAGVAVHADIPSTPAYSVYVADETNSEVDVPAPFPQAEWIAGIDPDKGAKVFKKCTSCHNAVEGGKNGTGPALWNVVGRPAGVGADFSYSPAMASSGIRWNYAELDAYLTNPKAYVPKTKMAFIGVKKPADRAAVIEYLRLASDAPLEPLTEAAAIPGAEVELNVDGANPEASADLSVDGEIIATETVDEAVDNLIDEAADVVDAVEDVVEEVVEDVKDAMSPPVEDVKVTVPAPDGGH